MRPAQRNGVTNSPIVYLLKKKNGTTGLIFTLQQRNYEAQNMDIIIMMLFKSIEIYKLQCTDAVCISMWHINCHGTFPHIVILAKGTSAITQTGSTRQNIVNIITGRSSSMTQDDM